MFRLHLLNEKNASLSDKLKLAIEESLSSEEKALRFEEILKEEEKSVEVKMFFMVSINEESFVFASFII